MNLLILSRGYDTAGTGIALKRAFDACAPRWSARAVRRKASWLGYPADIEWTRQSDALVRQLFARADVVHVMQTPGAVSRFPHPGKRIIVQHHGTYFRENAAAVSAACRAIGADEVAVSHELLILAPQARLLPNVVDTAGLRELRRAYRPSGRVRIAHAPTDRAVKSTDAFLRATERLSARYPISVDLIERVPWAECLARKSQADILFDQVILGYGLNAIEAWAMGIPVVAGLANTQARAMLIDDLGPVPWIDATEDTIEQALEPLVADAALRAEWGERGQEFAERIHSQRAVVERAISLYERTAAAA